jgi:2-amino-4-hydroxy-6-hydroxymethyldihydropteridine diphosphokinase
MNKAYLLLGGNMGDRLATLALAIQWLEELCGSIEKSSSVYETAAWGLEGQPAFYNQVLLLNTTLPAETLMENILLIEERMGRLRKEKYGPRVIDIDILLFNQDVIHTPLLTVPHPEMGNRRFVLAPLHEIAPALLHPTSGLTISQLLNITPDNLAVTKLGF